MTTEFEQRAVINQAVKRETRVTFLLSLTFLASIAMYAAVAYFIRVRVVPGSFKTLQTIWEVFSFITVGLVIVVLAVRKTIYFSPRLIRDDFTLVALLQRWRVIDIILLTLAEAIAILGLILALLGLPFSRTYFFFVSAFLVTMILMPIPWKVRDKLRYFEKYAGKLDE